MKNTASNIDQVVTGSQGRFVSLLVSKGINRQAYSAKIDRVTDSFVYFTDYNVGKKARKVRTSAVLRVACGKAIYSKVRV
jgi:hypothetical protein|tara:strand:+ start:771 stop:1010 length:240 start_codon:yes stop_codon:yes gene_type:complete